MTIGHSYLNCFTISKCLLGQSLNYFSEWIMTSQNYLFTIIPFYSHVWTHILPYQVQTNYSSLDILYLVYVIPHFNSLPVKTPLYPSGYYCYLYLEVFHGILPHARLALTTVFLQPSLSPYLISNLKGSVYVSVSVPN